jgi:Fe-S cluster biogenesis protein NfuA
LFAKMNIGRRLKKSSPEASKSRYAVIADGGPDPQAPAAPDTSEPVARIDTDGPGSTEPVHEIESILDAEPIPDAAALGLEELEPDELERRRAALEELITLMRPAVQMDGGDLALVDADYHAGIVEVELQGACGSCAISSTTLTGGVERLLKERLDWVTEVHGGVDDSVDPFESAALGRGAYVPRYY